MRKVLAMLLSAAMFLAAAGCAGKAGSQQPAQPDAVGTIGETQFSAQLYQLLRLNTAKENPDASAETLRQKTLEELERYAAVESEFAGLGGRLSQETLEEAQAYGDQLWENASGELEANRIDRAALDAYLRNLYKEDALLGLLYGTGGREEVSDQQILDYVKQNFYYGFCLYLPLGETGDPEAVAELARQAAEELDAGADLAQTAERLLPQACEAAGREYDPARLSSYYYPNMFTPENEEANLSAQAIETLHRTPIGGTAVLVNPSNVTVFQRTDPEEDYSVEEMRLYATVRMKGKELEERLRTRGKELEHRLDEQAVSALEQIGMMR